MAVPKNQAQVLEMAAQATMGQSLAFPLLYNLDSNGKYRLWQIHVAIMQKDTGDLLPVEKKYIERAPLPKGYVGAFWTTSGQEGGVIQSSQYTYVLAGKNLGHSNYTTPFTQAILDARSDHQKKMRKGYVLASERDTLKLKGTDTSIEELSAMVRRGAHPWRVFAMALHDVSDDNWSRVQYPCYVQPKYDGVLYIVVAHPALPGGIDGYSRGREDYEQQSHILEELLPLLRKYPGLHLVGEIWRMGGALQKISGLARRKADSKLSEPQGELVYVIYDCFRLDRKEPFEERLGTIQDLAIELGADANSNTESCKGHICFAPTAIVANRAELEARFQQYLAAGYEGAVIRNSDSLYEFGIDKEYRSYQTLKYKPRPDAEFPVVDFKQGAHGKEVGALIWTCAENDAGLAKRLKAATSLVPHVVRQEGGPLVSLGERRTFNVTPNDTYERRYALYSVLQDERVWEKIKGQLYTVSYSILSEDGLPQQPKGKGFRDPKIAEFLEAQLPEGLRKPVL